MPEMNLMPTEAIAVGAILTLLAAFAAIGCVWVLTRLGALLDQLDSITENDK
jgi:hypothetical protein